MPASRLTLDDLARYPRPGLAVPHSFQFSPDGRTLAYLHQPEAAMGQDLWLRSLDRGTTRRISLPIGDPMEGSLDLDEQLRRERARVRESGITRFQLGANAANEELLIVFPAGDSVYLVRQDGEPQQIPSTQGAMEARLSPDGRLLAFVRGDDLYVLSLDGSTPPRRLTEGAGNGVTNGMAEFIAQEEMGRSEGYWWSPDGSRIAFVHADSSGIPLYSIVHQEAVPFVEQHRYPFSGGPNALVRLGVVAATGPAQQPVWMDLGSDSEIYLARVHWRDDGTLFAQLQPRDQRSLRLVAFDGTSGVATLVREERTEPYVNLHDDLRFLPSGEILWSSEESGFRHLYVLAPDGSDVRQITQGDWMVTGVAGIDQLRRLVYFHGTYDSPVERHLYGASLDGGPLRRLTADSGMHAAVLSSNGSSYVDSWSSTVCAPVITCGSLTGASGPETIFAQPALSAEALGMVLPELTSFTTEDGETLHAAVYASQQIRTDAGAAPLLVSVYGGPHAQMVLNSWALTVDLRAQYLAQQGFVILKVDNRGSAARGLAFEAAVAGRLGHREVEDQVAAVRWLSRRSYVDGSRVGIYGWSYGGYLTLRALMRAPDVFAAGVAGAPVTFWQGYDTHYTERYMRGPLDNTEGYEASAVLPQAGELRGNLLIVHGLVDENVHVRHTVLLLEALARAGKQYNLVLLPKARHMVRAPHELRYLEQRLTAFFQEHLDREHPSQ